MKKDITIKDVKGLVVIVQLENGVHQVVTARRIEWAVLNLITQLSPEGRLCLIEVPMEGISIDYPEGCETFEQYADKVTP
jgi:hypothetical protein